MLAVILIFCDYARAYAPCLWLSMLERGNYARGCAHFFYLFDVLHSICDFCVSMARFPLFICCFARDHYFPNSPVLLELFQFYNVARHHTENFPGDRHYLRRVLRHAAYTMYENENK